MGNTLLSIAKADIKTAKNLVKIDIATVNIVCYSINMNILYHTKVGQNLNQKRR